MIEMNIKNNTEKSKAHLSVRKEVVQIHLQETNSLKNPSQLISSGNAGAHDQHDSGAGRMKKNELNTKNNGEMKQDKLSIQEEAVQNDHETEVENSNWTEEELSNFSKELTTDISESFPGSGSTSTKQIQQNEIQKSSSKTTKKVQIMQRHPEIDVVMMNSSSKQCSSEQKQTCC